MTQPQNLQLAQRAEVLLNALIRRYVTDGQPVGSRTLSRESSLDLSPATIRNVMADLEDLGLITSPHTSSGRIPTQQGYRFFVDSIMKVRPLKEGLLNDIREQLDSHNGREEVLQNATQMLSQITQFAGVIMPTKQRNLQLRQVEFLGLSGNRILSILVTNDGHVENRVLNTAKAYTESELVEAANCFNNAFSGKSLSDVREKLLTDLKADNQEADRIMRTAVTMVQDLFDTNGEHADDVVVRGETNLMGVPEFTEVGKLKSIFETFRTKHNLLDLMERSIRGDGIQIFIGDESGYEAFTDCSVITAPYNMEGEGVGVIGVIGPTRMAYEDIVPVVDITARLIGNVLSHAES
ncbi:MAG: heat-inducible transcriptional repressor [Parasphingorhabdus sp.]